MAEEHRCQAQQRLCANNCGFFGCPTTQDLCSKCYRDLQLKEQQSSNAKLAFNQTLTAVTAAAAASSPLTSSSSISVSSSPAVIDLPEVSSNHAPEKVEESKGKDVVEEEMPAVAVRPNRCLSCRKRVGLTGFKCRCGMVFCGTHRYPEQHGCSFDFKAMGKEQIAKANPIVKADKLEKI